MKGERHGEGVHRGRSPQAVGDDRGGRRDGAGGRPVLRGSGVWCLPPVAGISRRLLTSADSTTSVLVVACVAVLIRGSSARNRSVRRCATCRVRHFPQSAAAGIAPAGSGLSCRAAIRATNRFGHPNGTSTATCSACARPSGVQCRLRGVGGVRLRRAPRPGLTSRERRQLSWPCSWRHRGPR